MIILWLTRATVHSKHKVLVNFDNITYITAPDPKLRGQTYISFGSSRSVVQVMESLEEIVEAINEQR